MTRIHLSALLLLLVLGTSWADEASPGLNMADSSDAAADLEKAIAEAAESLPEDAKPIIIASPSSSSAADAPDNVMSEGQDADDNKKYDLYLIDTNRLPPSLAQLLHSMPGLNYGQDMVTFLHRASGGLVPNAGLIRPNEVLQSEEVASGLVRQRRALLLKKGLLAKKFIGVKLLVGKGLIVKKLLLAKTLALPLLLKAKTVAIVGGLIAKPIILKGLVAKKVIGVPLVKAAVIKAPLAAAAVKKVGVAKVVGRR